MEQNKKYFAFISYKSEDIEWAIWLQHELEHYCLPASFNGRTDIRQELRPVFRDTDELSAGNLPEQIKEALENSQNLIVICSPQAATSSWVNKEVKMFITLGRTNRIFPFIIEGSSPDEFFPRALRTLPKNKERLGGDASKQGRDVAFVKVVAGMLGVHFDDLWDRYGKEKAINERKQREQRDHLLMLQSRFVSAKAENVLKQGDSILSKRLVLEVLPKDILNPDRPYTPEAEYILRVSTLKDRTFLPVNDSDGNYAKYSPDGSVVAIAMNDGTIRLLNLKTNEIKFLGTHGLGVNFLEYSNDGNYIVSISDDWNVIVWDIYSTECQIIKLSCSAKCVHFDRNDEYIIITTKEWDANKRDVIKIFDYKHQKWLSEVFCPYNIISANFSSNSDKVIILSEDNVIRIVNLHDIINQDNSRPLFMELLNSIDISCKDEIINADFYIDNSHIVASSNEIVYILDLNGTIVHSFPHAFIKTGDTLNHFAVDKTGLKLVTSSFEGEVKVWDVKSEICVFSDMMGSFTNFSPDSHSIISVCKDKGVIICNVWNELSYRYDYTCNSLDCDSDSTNHLVLSSKNVLFVNNINKSVLIYNGNAEIVTACYSSDYLRIILVLRDDTIRILNASDGECLMMIKDEDGKRYLSSVENIIVSPDNIFLATTYSQYTLFSLVKPYREFAKKICIWNCNDQKILNILEGHNDAVNAISFAPNRNLLISASKDRTIRVWNIITGRCLRVINAQNNEGHFQSVNDVAYDSDGSHFVSCSSDKTIKIWDSKTYKCIRTLIGHSKEVNCVCFAYDHEMDRQLVVSVATHDSIRMWDIERGQCICEYKNDYDVEWVKFDAVKRMIILKIKNQYDSNKNSISIITYPLLQELILKYQGASFAPEERKQYYLE